MKVQCSCGAKYEFEITAAMASRPVQFVCPACRTDASDFVDSLVRRQLGQSSKPSGERVLVTGSASNAPQATRLGLAVRSEPHSRSAEPDPEVAVEGQPCSKHPGQVATARCYICSKPICPQCMELFGYICSPLCKATADSHGIQI